MKIAVCSTAQTLRGDTTIWSTKPWVVVPNRRRRRGRMRELLADMGPNAKGVIVYERFLTRRGYVRGLWWRQ